jgi:hypothetical protein
VRYRFLRSADAVICAACGVVAASCIKSLSNASERDDNTESTLGDAGSGADVDAAFVLVAVGLACGPMDILPTIGRVAAEGVVPTDVTDAPAVA